MKNTRHQRIGVRLTSIAIMLAIFVSAVFMAEPQPVAAAPLYIGTSNALQFDGVNDYVSFGDPAALHLTAFTLEVKFMITGTGVTTTTGGVTAIPLIAKGRDETGGEGNTKDLNYFLGINTSNKLVGDFEDTYGSNHAITGSTTLSTGVWYHAALTYRAGSRLRLYLNGVQEKSVNTSSTPRSTSIQHASLGSALTSSGTPGGYFNGILDEARIWNTNRSSTQISGNMNTRITSPATNLVARWGMDEGAGATVGDISGNNVNSTVFSLPTWVHGYWNAAPVANAQSVTMAENSPKAITLVATDSDDDDLSYTITSSPANGTLSGAAPDLTYTPNDYYNGSDSFQFKVNDGVVDSGTVTVSITITAVNFAPVANAQSVTTAENAAKAFTLAGSDPDGDSITYSISENPAHGALSGTLPNVTYTPDAYWNGIDTFKFKTYDGSLYSPAATVTVTVTSVNYAPVANAQSVTTAENTAKAITLTASDLDSDPLTYTVTTQPTHGTLSGTAPNLTYTPVDYWFGTDTFKFKVNDGTVESAVATVTITVTGVNYAPVADAQSVTTAENAAMSITLTGSDPDGDSLTYSISNAPDHGSLSGALPDITYTPDAYWNGTDTFNFVVNDGTVDSPEATVTVTVTAVNYPPAADSQGVTTAENAAKAITLTGSDPDGDALSYTVTANPAHGTLSGTEPALTYTPDDYWNGTDTFKFKVNDGTVDSTEATVTITVTAVNYAPVADSQSLTMNENESKAITLGGSDLDSDPLTFVITVNPANGTLTGAAPDVTYTPTAQFSGTDSFKFRVNDGTVDSPEATVSITINSFNHAPTADAQAVTTPEDVAKAITLSGSDQDGDSITYSLGSNPAHGTLSGALPDVLYTPESLWNGTDSFTFKVSDGEFESAEATVTITVTPVNNAPVAGDQSASTVENIATSITLTGSDPDGDTITYFISANPSHGTLSGTPPNVNYLPDNDWSGTDTFRFKTNDGVLDSDEAVVTVTVTSINTAPLADAQTVSMNENETLAVALSGSDPDGDPLDYIITTNPAHGSLTGAPPDVTYSPSHNWTGTDTFKFKTNDGTVDSPEVVVTITVASFNHAPVATGQSRYTAENSSRAIVLTGVDVDGDPLTFTITQNPSNGTLTGTVPNLIYVPDAYWNGIDSFKFIASDGALDSDEAEVTITVLSVNFPPVADGQSVSTDENTDVSITLAGSDPDGDPISYAVTQAPLHGTVSGAAPDIVYTPDTYWNGIDIFRFNVNDGSLNSSDATVIVMVTAVNSAPLANNQSVTTPENTPALITLVGSDPDNDPITYIVTTQPINGTLSGSDSVMTYTPNSYWNGSDVFRFKVNDGTVDSAEATVSISVTSVNYAPNVADQFVSTQENSPVGINFIGSDPDGDLITYSVTDLPAHGTLNGTPPNLVYTPNNYWSGTDTLKFRASDGLLNSPEATVTITVASVNYAPSAYAQSLSTAENAPKSITISGSDPDNDPLTYVLVNSPLHGVLSGAAPNLVYTPNNYWNGIDAFSFKVNDGALDSPEATVTLTVTPVNFAPVANDLSVTTDENTAKLITLTGSDPDADPLSFSVSGLPAHGTLSGTPPSITYTPNPYWNGTDTFTYKASDGALNSPDATVTVSVTSVNYAPVADHQSVTTDENAAVNVTLTGSDPDSDPVTFEIKTQPAHGVLSGTAPDVTYTPNAYWNGTDSFKFVVNDGTVNSSLATVTIDVTAVNYAPQANDQFASTGEDTPKALTLTGSDVDGDSLSFQITTPPAHGALSGTAPDLTYTPDANFNGDDSFKYTASDGALDSAEATFNVVVVPGNDVPVADSQSVTTDEETAKDIVLTGSDADGDGLTYILTVQPEHGTLTGTAPELNYAPAADFNGTDVIKFKVNDGTVDSPEATVTITVAPANDAPVTGDQNLTTPEDTAASITLGGTDVDGDSLNFVIMVPPSNGTLSGVAPDVIYTPNANFAGEDSFKFVANDGTVDSPEATVSITVTSSDDAPTADDQTVATDEHVTVDITLAGSDPESAPLNFEVTVQPEHGALAGVAPALSYSPTGHFNGTDTFKFKVNDGSLDSPEATVTVEVAAVNDAPTANDQAVAAEENSSAEITLAGFDPKGDSLTFDITAAPEHGTLSGAAPDLVYTPETDWSGVDAFKFTAFDGELYSAEGTVTISVAIANDPPTADDQSITTDEHLPASITLSGSDPNGDPLTFAVTVPPANGALDGTPPDLTYTPDGHWNGADTFKYKSNDSHVDSPEATVTITVNPINDAPTADSQSVSVDEDAAKDFVLTGTDVDGDALAFTVASQPANGALSGTAPDLIYTPNAEWNGTDSFKFTVQDGSLDSTEATVTLVVNAVNDAPVAVDQSVRTDKDVAKAIVLTGTDIDGNPLTYTVAVNPAHGALSGTSPALTYTPELDWSGIDSFTFTASDGELVSAEATVTIAVAQVNEPPLAADQSVSTEEDVARAITLTGSDPNGDTLSFSISVPPAHGVMTGTSPDFTYTPNANWNGTDTFKFKSNDGELSSADATVTVVVTPLNDGPQLVQNAGAAITLGQTLTLTDAILLVADPDNTADQLVYKVQQMPVNGNLFNDTVQLNLNDTFTQADINSGSIKYVQVNPSDYNDTFMFSVSDPDGIEPVDVSSTTPATFVVGGTVVIHAADDGAPGSLRYVINTNARAGSTVTFDKSLAGQSIVLNSPVTFEKDLTISGAGVHGVVISGGAGRALVVNEGVNVTLENLTIADSNADNGGAVLNYGNLTINNSTFSANNATGNGGAVVNENTGTLTINNSTFSGNSAAQGGALYNNGGSLNLHSVTIANSLSGSGLFVESGSATVTNSLLTGSEPDDCAGTGAVVSDGYNLVSRAGACAFNASTDKLNLNPDIGPLSDNGGETLTHALVSKSPAIDTGNCGGLSVDQIRTDRPQGPKCDIGAYEHPLPTEVFYDDSASEITYTNSLAASSATQQWSRDDVRGIHLSAKTGNFATFTFFGDRLALRYMLGSKFGKVDVFVDDVRMAKLSQKGKTGSREWSVDGLGSRVHVLRVVHQSGKQTNIDAIIVRQATSLATISDGAVEETDLKVSYSGLWTFTGTTAVSSVTKETAKLNFSSARLRLDYDQASKNGSLDVGIDGAHSVINQKGKASPRSWFYSGVDGTHYLTLLHSKGKTVDFDRIVLIPPAQVAQPGSVIQGNASDWLNFNGVWLFNGTQAQTGAAKSSVTLRFTGTGATINYLIGKAYGVMDVQVDGVSIGRVDQRKKVKAPNLPRFVVSGLTSGAHELTLVHFKGKSINLTSIEVAP